VIIVEKEKSIYFMLFQYALNWSFFYINN